MKHTVLEFLRYASVSLLALGADLALFSFLLRCAGLPWMLAATAGFVIGVLVAYWLSIRFVFFTRRLAHAPRSEFAAFAFIGVIGLAITQMVLWVGIELFRLNPELTKVGAAGVTFLCNFGMRKLMLFHHI
ncbi:MAG: GtrA family protein [Pseudomonadota bacterium]